MLNNAKGFNRIYIATGFTDLRRGIEGLSGIIEKEFHLDPFDRNTLFLFCGNRNDRIKGLLWEGDGFLLLYKRLASGGFLMAPVISGSVGDHVETIPPVDVRV
jgi:transposase